MTERTGRAPDAAHEIRTARGEGSPELVGLTARPVEASGAGRRASAETDPASIGDAHSEAERLARATEENEEAPLHQFSYLVEASDPDENGCRQASLKIRTSAPQEIDLAQYLPELRGVQMYVIAGMPNTVHLDAGGTVRIPAILLAKTDEEPGKDAQTIVSIFEQAIAATLPETKDVLVAEKKLAEALGELYEETALKRMKKYKTLEAAVVAAREKKHQAVQKRLKKVIKDIAKGEHIDLLAEFGGKDKWEKDRQVQHLVDWDKAGYLFAEKPKTETNSEHADSHENSHHGESNRRSAINPVEIYNNIKDLAKLADNELTIRDMAIDACYEKEIKKIKSETAAKLHKIDEDLAAGVIGGTTASIKKALIESRELPVKIKRLMLKYPGGLAKSMGMVGAAAAVPVAGVGLGILDILKLPGLNFMQEGLAEMANSVFHFVGLPIEVPTGKKKGGGHDGGDKHH